MLQACLLPWRRSRASYPAHLQTSSTRSVEALSGPNPTPQPQTPNLTPLQVNARSANTDICVRVSFLEIYNENIRDLLDHSPAASSKSISIRDDAQGNVKVMVACDM